MGNAGKPSGKPSLAPASTALVSRRRARRRQTGGQSSASGEAQPGIAEVYQRHYRPLFRLAALLTGDTDTAQEVVTDSFVAALHHLRRQPPTCDDMLPYLRRLVVARSRLAKHSRPTQTSQPPELAQPPGPADIQLEPFESAPVIRALRTLPASQREAIVLTLYLDLTDDQAAAAMRVSQVALHHCLAEARTALRTVLPANP